MTPRTGLQEWNSLVTFVIMLRCRRLSTLGLFGERRCLATTITTQDSSPQTTEGSARAIPITLQPDRPSGSHSADHESDQQQHAAAGESPRLGFTPPEEEEVEAPPLYDTHIRTNPFQKTILTFGAAAAALLDPRRHDMVAVLGETTGGSALARLHTAMVEDPEGCRILVDKPRINSSTIDLDTLAKLPKDTLGRMYISFLEDNKVTPDSRLPVQFVDDPELAYVMQRYREGHDLFHTTLGMPTNMLGEVAVKWVEAIQTGLPMCYGAAVFGPLRFRPKQRQKYVSVYLPWAIRVGRTARLLMNVYFEERWDQSIHQLREEFGVEAPPSI